MSLTSGSLIVIHPSVDYAKWIIEAGEQAVFVVGPERAFAFQDLDNAICLGELSSASVSRALQTYGREHGVQYNGVTCFVCEYLPLAAELASTMGLQFPAAEVVHRSRNKDLAYTSWTASGVPTPASLRINEVADLAAFAEKYASPWVLKPADGTGSAWVRRVDDAHDLAKAYSSQRRNAAGERGGNQTPFLIQSFVSGRELSADFYIDGETLTMLRVSAKLKSDRLGEVVAYYPAVTDVSEQQAVTDVLRRAAQSLGLRRGLANADLMLTTSGPLVLEMAMRPGGDCLPDLCRAAHGYDPIREACRVARGLPPRSDQPWVERVAFAAVHLMSDQVGVIEQISFADLIADPTVISCEPYVVMGNTLDPSSGRYEDRIVGSCLMRVDSVKDLERRAPRLIDKVNISTRISTPRKAPVMS
ncbi:MAG: ATP-grasp domain-containing protein [Proteobacteria bacterium]|nr:ATP-grasp domain-containing protein [Pseudomonadota bacterium]